MSFLQRYTLKISTLSPVHMGCDETYEPTNYVISEGVLYEFNTQEALEALTVTERANLLQIVSARPDQELIKKVQGFFYRQRDRLIASAGHSLPVGPGVATLYESRVGKAAHREDRGKQVINKLEIERTAYNVMDRMPVFPGSGIKGAIRTALLDSANHGEEPRGREKNRDLQQRLFDYTMRELHKDPMRLVQVGDARWEESTGLPGSEIRFAVNRKRRPVLKDGKLMRSQAEQKGLYQLLECVPPYCSRALTHSLTLQKMDAAGDARDKLPARELRWGIGEISRACNRFYLPLFQREIRLLEQRDYVDPVWAESVRKLLPGKDDERIFLLRLGRHSGAEALTLNGARKIRIMRGRQDASDEKEPTTFWLAAPQLNSQTGMLPFGWVLVEVDPVGESPIPLTGEVQGLREWAEIQRGRKDEYERKREQERQKAREKAEQQRQEEQRQEARRKQLESLSPVERELEEFLADFAGDNPGAELCNLLLSSRWDSAEDCQVVAARIMKLWETDGKWNPDFSGSNKQKKKQRERCVKVQEFLG